MKKYDIEFIIITAVSIILGTAMHFAHHLSFFGTFLGCIFPVNECVWEHMKMLFYPMLLTSIYYSLRQKDIRAFGGMIATCVVSIPVQIALFYGYWIFTGHSVIIVDIIAYLAVMIAAYVIGRKLTANAWIRSHWKLFVAVAVLGVILLAVLTYHHPEINLFIPEE